MIEEVKKFSNVLNESIINGLLNSTWFFIKDIENFELKFYFDISLLKDDLLDKCFHEPKFLNRFK